MSLPFRRLRLGLMTIPVVLSAVIAITGIWPRPLAAVVGVVSLTSVIVEWGRRTSSDHPVTAESWASLPDGGFVVEVPRRAHGSRNPQVSVFEVDQDGGLSEVITDVTLLDKGLVRVFIAGQPFEAVIRIS